MPSSEGRVEVPKYKYERDDYVDREEIERMIDGASELGFKALLAFLYLYGCRISEALKMYPRDIYLKWGKWLYAEIPLSKKRKAHKSPIKPKHTLRVSVRQEKFKPLILPLLKHLTDRRRSHYQEPLWDMTRVTVWRKIKDLNPNLSSHFLRHNRLHDLAVKGASAFELQDWAGWADARPAANYIAVTGELASHFSEKID